MAEEGNFLPESTSSAVGSRRSRAAAFGDNTLDDRSSLPPADGGVELLSRRRES